MDDEDYGNEDDEDATGNEEKDGLSQVDSIERLNGLGRNGKALNTDMANYSKGGKISSLGGSSPKHMRARSTIQGY